MSISSNQENFELTAAERAAIEEEMHHYEDSRAASIEALKIVQKARGWVPDGAIPAIANILGICAPDVEGVATFYSQIYRKPVGRHVIRYCDSVVCYVNGAEKMHRALVKKLNIKPGETTFDGRFTLIPTCCLGKCDKGPSIMINDETLEYVTAENIEQLLEKYQ